MMMLSEQVLINSGVLFVRAAEGAAAAGFIFNVLMVARAPAGPLPGGRGEPAAAPRPPAGSRRRGERRARSASSLTTTVMGVALFATATTLGVLAIGPQVMQLAFGDKFDYDRLGLAIVAVGMGLYLAAVSLNQAVIAEGRALRAALPWLASAAALRRLQPVAASERLPDGGDRLHRLGRDAGRSVCTSSTRVRRAAPPNP